MAGTKGNGCGYLRVTNYSALQHYKDRNPPWIKLYYDLLDTEEFLCLQDASKFHLLGIMLLASRFDNRVPYRPQWVAHRIGANQPIDFSALISSGFLENCDASNVLAGCKQNAMPETETETEKTLSAGADVASDPVERTASGAGIDTPTAKPLRTRTPNSDKPKPAAKPEHRATLRYFGEQWKARYGTDYAPTHGKDDKHVKTILDRVGRDAAQARALIDAYFADDDPWLRERAHELGLLVSRFNRYRARDLTPAPDAETGFVRAPVDDDLIAFVTDGAEVNP